jgi:hypothetical protein
MCCCCSRDGLVRVLSVLKVRFSADDASLREFRIVAQAGLRVLPLAESGVDALAGIAREQGKAVPPSGEGDATRAAGTP